MAYLILILQLRYIECVVIMSYCLNPNFPGRKGLVSYIRPQLIITMFLIKFLGNICPIV